MTGIVRVMIGASRAIEKPPDLRDVTPKRQQLLRAEGT
jgi:hypothetical protein